MINSILLTTEINIKDFFKKNKNKNKNNYNNYLDKNVEQKKMKKK